MPAAAWATIVISALIIAITALGLLRVIFHLRAIRKTLVATKSTQSAVVALMLINRSTGRVRTLARGSLYGYDFSPKGDELVYSRAPQATEAGICGDLMDLYVAKVAGGKPEQLTHNGFSAFPVWGPSKIAFSRFPQSFDIQDCAAPGVWTIDPKPGSRPQSRARRSGCGRPRPGARSVGLTTGASASASTRVAETMRSRAGRSAFIRTMCSAS